jgi:hypothetical protein
LKLQVKNDVRDKADGSAAVDADGAENAALEEVEMRNMVRSQNRKKKSGGFQSMGKAFNRNFKISNSYWFK